MKKLKNINFKGMFIDHGEKMGLGLIVLLVLLALSSTSWSKFAGSPEELDKKAKDARTRITSLATNPWPKEKQETFKVVDFNDRAHQLFSRIDQTKFEFTTPLWHPLYRKRELAREPEYLPVEFLLASSGRAILGVKPTGSADAGSSMATGGSEASVDAGPAVAGTTPAAGTGFKLPGAATAGGGANPVAGAPGGGAHGGGGGGAPMRLPSPVAAGGGGAHGGGAAMPGGADMFSGMGSGGGGGGGGQVAARGVRYVAVRGVFPLRQQVEKYQRALNATAADAGLMFELLDFVLERQAAVAGPNPWSGKWEAVNVDTALEVLNEASDFELDPVQTGVTDSVITMSLPHRILEYWGDHATHPNVRDFQLKPEEMERELKLQQKLVEEYEKAQLQSEPKVRRRGLSAGQNDLRQMGQEMMSSNNANTMMTSMQSSMGESSGGGGGGRMTVPDIKQRLTANGRLLLFRYFDFDVQPGMAYRYRVKLKIRNPNFERAREEVVDPAYTEGPERETDWSNISNASVIPNSVDYFLKDVERDPTRDDKVRAAKAVASIAMFEWDSKLGTMLSDTLRILSVGQFIAEKKKTIVVDAAALSYEDAKEVAFNTGDVLLDAAGDFDLSPEQHPELGLKADKGRPVTKLGLLPEAVVLNSLGELRQLDPALDKSKEQALKKRVDEERGLLIQFKDTGAKAASGLDGGSAAFDMLMGGSGSSGGKAPGKGAAPKSPRKKAGGASSSSSSESMPGGAGGSSGAGKMGQSRRTP